MYYTIHCDNYFTGIKLFDYDSIYACGTLRSNRVGYPNEFRKYLKRPRFEGRAFNFREVTNYSLFGKTTNLSISYQLIAQKKKEQSLGLKIWEQKICSFPVKHNRLQQIYVWGRPKQSTSQVYYCVRLKGRKLNRYIFWYLYEVTVTNVYVLTRYTCTYFNLFWKTMQYRYLLPIE